MKFPTLAGLFATLAFCAAGAEPDIMLADFEGKDYGAWKATGEAFGAGPSQGGFPRQMKVEGYLGKGLVNSFLGGDKATGTLTSPEFKLERRYVTFLIGGGGFQGRTCMNLLVDGKVVRTATGPNTKPGGSEALAPQSWDVSEFLGHTARIEIVDQATGGWGHINVDHIVQTERKASSLLTNAKRELELTQQWLHFPVKTGALKRKVQVLIDGKVERFFDIELADAQADWWAPLDVSAWKGKRAAVMVDKLPEDSQALAMLEQGAGWKNAENIYQETLRPQFHFSPKRGWNNDPNGLAFYNGEYHLFFQHNPYGWGWGNMHWGHAVSRDLVHWQELGETLYPDNLGPMFSGSAVVDVKNTSGFGKDGKAPLVLIYTAAGNPSVQCLAYSTDGKNFTKYARNPILANITPGNRDPKVFWHEPTGRWVMVLYVSKEKRHTVHFLTSTNLREWTLASVTEGGEDKDHYLYECPDFFELAVDGVKKWVLTAANSEYSVGTFDGMKFTPEATKLPGVQGNGFYAAQTYSDEPQGRRIQVGWLRAPSPGMAFNQCMTVPLELTLHTTPLGPRLHWLPVRELDSLRGKSQTIAAYPLKPGDNPIANFNGGQIDLRAELEVGDAALVGFRIHGVEVTYDAKKQELICKDRRAAMPAPDGIIRLRILGDRTSLEIFGGDGLVYMPMPVLPRGADNALAIFAREGTAKIRTLDVSEMQSAWSESLTRK